MNKQDMLKIQTCVLRVNIHCEGCMHKVKKKLQKVKGVYKVHIDAEQGRVSVSGNADPASLIEKLEKAGKHAELWGPPKGWGPQKGHPVVMDKAHHNKNGNGFVQIPHKKEEKHPAKDLKSVRFDLPEDDEDDDDFDDDDEDYDDDEDFSDDEFDGTDPHKPVLHKPASKAKGAKANHKGNKGGIDVFLKSMLKKAGRKNDKKSNKGEDKKKGDGGKNGGKKGGFELGDVKKGKNDFDSWSKKDFDGGKHQQQQQKGFTDMKVNHKGGGGGGGGGRNMGMMGHKEGIPAGMNDGRFLGAGPGNNPYSQQQQQMAHMMMMMNQQQRENGHGAYHPSAYARPPPPAMVYGPAPAASEQYTHMFSDENTGSCSIM